MATPVQDEENELADHSNETRQYNVLGNLCLAYGTFVLLLTLIPNEPRGRLIIFCCGALVTGIGLFLKALGKLSKAVLGTLCLCYGIFMLLLVLVPKLLMPTEQVVIWCGAAVISIGLFLKSQGKRS